MSEHTTEYAHIAEVLALHRYRDVLGDYEIAPYYKHFGCSCGWEQNIAGMNGWRSWIAAHEAHVAEQVAEALGARTERRWGVSLANGVYETHTEESAIALSGPRPDSGPAVTCLRTTYAVHETPWVEVVVPPGVSS